MGFGNLFGMRGNLKRLGSSEEIDLSSVDRVHVHLDKHRGDLGLTIGNTEDGSGVIIVAVAQSSICYAAGVRPGQVIFRVNEHDVGTHAEAVALMDKAAKGLVLLELSKIEADPDTVDEIARSPHRSASSGNLYQ
mmetsp:Transcript_513/g.1332  ORF Transcript_513/g.1332 Transcript_513/m.1332 type:complete len:135 (-) Transcript_513:2538-2942(-)